MIVFSIALKSKQVSKNWDHTCILLKRTLNSIYNQTNQDFKVVIVCHEKPSLSSPYPNLIYHQVDFLPPENSYPEMILDRDIKEVLGRKIAKEMESDYIMVIDSDDCINKEIVDYVNQQAGNSVIPDGFFANSGYIFYEKSNKIVPRSGLYHCCGSTVVLKSELCDVPESWQYDDLVEFKQKGKFFSHGSLVSYWQSKGRVIKPFPFRGCIYIRPDFEPGLDATRNVLVSSWKRRNLKLLLSPVKRKLEKVAKAQDVTQDIKNNFGFYAIDSNYSELENNDLSSSKLLES